MNVINTTNQLQGQLSLSLGSLLLSLQLSVPSRSMVDVL